MVTNRSSNNKQTDKLSIPSCTVVVNSCDSYEDTWYPFFKIFKAEWPDCKFPIVLNTESKTYSYDDLPITCFKLYKDTTPPWSKRLLDTLVLINSKYVLLLLDDFFFTDKVDSEEIDFILEQMEKDSSIGVCYISPMNPIHTTDDDLIDFGGHTGYLKRNKFVNRWTFIRDFAKPYLKKDLRGLNLVNAQAAIWNKEFLIKTLNPKESAWDWECFGTVRAYKMPEKFISVSRNRRIIPYDFSLGTGIINGVWVPDVVEPLFKKYDINIDLSVRGIKGPDWNYKHNKRLYKKVLTVFENINKLFH